MSTVTNLKPLGFNWEMYDPFLFCAHHKDAYPQGTETFGVEKEELTGRNMGSDFILKNGFRMYHGTDVPGFPVHPHRGFETVTITLEGLIDHADSLGGAGRYGYGDVQWMTAGKGIQHTEMFPLLHSDRNNPLELLQIWINLPKSAKFVDPYYKMLWNEDIPERIFKNDKAGNSVVRVISGMFHDTRAPQPTPDSWAANPENEVAIWLVNMPKNATLELPKASEDITRAIYFYRGDQLDVGGTQLPSYHQAVLDPTQKIVLTSKDSNADFLVVQGKPIAEPVAQYGPFVMNTRSEIQQAYQDFTETRFGGWPWDTNEPVHGKELRRFARFPGGEEEVRELTHPG